MWIYRLISGILYIIMKKLDFQLEQKEKINDTIYSIPAKPLPYGKLKCGGFFFLWGTVL